MKELAMKAMARICLPLLRGWEWPKINIAGAVRSFGEAIELYRRALSLAYDTALFASSDAQSKCRPDDDFEGRDPRW
jgi:hypothetical protein